MHHSRGEVQYESWTPTTRDQQATEAEQCERAGLGDRAVGDAEVVASAPGLGCPGNFNCEASLPWSTFSGHRV